MVTKDGESAIIEVKNKGGITINEVAFTWLGQGIDEGMHVTTWWSTYLGCNSCLVCIDFGIQKLFLIFLYFFSMEKNL